MEYAIVISPQTVNCGEVVGYVASIYEVEGWDDVNDDDNYLPQLGKLHHKSDRKDTKSAALFWAANVTRVL